jgi:hypothetical protein
MCKFAQLYACHELFLKYTIHGHMPQEVDSSKYLGVTLSKDLRWDDHINTITAKANGTLHAGFPTT